MSARVSLPLPGATPRLILLLVCVLIPCTVGQTATPTPTPTVQAQVDVHDLFRFSQGWQQVPQDETSMQFDLFHDGKLDDRDLLLFLAQWHEPSHAGTPTPTPTGTRTWTPTFTPTGTSTDTPTPTGSPTWTPTRTPTRTPTFTPTPTPTPSGAITPGVTPLPELVINLPNLPQGAKPLVLRLIPSGSFMMGRYAGEQDSSDWEDPHHEVNIGYQFYMGKYEITQAQWLAVVGSNPASGYGVGSDYPVYYVSWNDIRGAGGFLEKLNALGQGTFRLPSEAEWEYACRATTATRFYWGDDPGYTQIGDYAWYTGNNTPYGSKPVGGKLENAWGLYDMSGNVWEWCEDWYHSSYTNAPSDGTAWVSPEGSFRVLRGSSWDFDPRVCRSASRLRNYPDDRAFDVGFRLARTP